MNYFLVRSFGPVTPDGQTESDAYEPTVHKHRCAKKCFLLQIRSNVLIKRGSLRMQNGLQTEALDDFATAVREDPDNSDIYHHRGQVSVFFFFFLSFFFSAWIFHNWQAKVTVSGMDFYMYATLSSSRK